MTDDELRTGLEACALPKGAFGHAEHVRLCFVYLRDEGLLRALEMYPRALLAQATHHGVPEKYHETVTWGMIFLIHERMARRPDQDDWTGFAAANADLMAWPESPLFDLYPKEILRSEFARTTFVLPGSPLADLAADGPGRHAAARPHRVGASEAR